MGRRFEGDVVGRDNFECGAFGADVKELPLEYLESLDIPDLYRLIHEHLDQKALVGRIIGNVAFKVALVVAWVDATLKAHAYDGGSRREANQMIMGSEAGFVRSLQMLGVHVDVQSELSRQQLVERPHLFMSTHQGGGLETYVLAELLRRVDVPDFRYVIKDELVNLPVVGKTIASREPILVHRSELRDEQKRRFEIRRVAEEIAGALANDEDVLFFFEGTRSKTGEIAGTENRRVWCRDLNRAIESAAAKYRDLEYGKALVVLDTLSVLPVAVEKELTAQVRTNGDCTAKILDATNLTFEENPEDPYDERTLFGRARSSLKETLIARARRYRGEGR